MKKVLYFTGILLILISAASAAPSVSVSPKEITAAPGQEFSVDIYVDPAGIEVYGAQFDLLFDKAMLEGLSITQGTFLSQDGATTITIVKKIDNTIGKAEYGEARMGAQNGVTTPGVLAAIKFKVNATAQLGINTTLALSNVELSDPNATPIPNVIINNGIVSIPALPEIKIIKPSEGQYINSSTIGVEHLASGNLINAANTSLQLDNNPEVIIGQNQKYSFSDVVDGKHTIHAWLVYANKTHLPNPEAHAVVNFTVDTIPPKVTIISPVSKLYNTKAIELNAKADEDIAVWEYVLNAGAKTAFTPPQIINAIEGNNAIVVYAADKAGNAGSANVSFIVDTTAPVITNIVNSTPTHNSVTISWSTNEDADSKVKYGTDKAKLDLSKYDAGIVKAHSLKLDGLQPNTTYYYTVNSTDLAGNSNESSVQSFRTAEVPPAPIVEIVKPAEGEVIFSSTVVVNYKESGDLTNVSHAHLKLDENPEVMDLDNDGVYNFTNVTGGEHTIHIWLADMNHNKLAGAYDIVNFTVKLPPVVSVTPPKNVVSKGQSFTVNIYVEPKDFEVYSGQFALLFDPGILEATSVDQGKFLSQDGASTIVGVKTINNTIGKIDYAETRIIVQNGVIIPGNMASITFKVKDTAQPGTITTLSIVNVELSDPNAVPISNVVINNGTVEVPKNIPPIANATTNHTANNAGSPAYLNGSGSYDPDGSIVSYTWDFGDGTKGAGAMTSHVYNTYKWDGTNKKYLPYNATLEVIDNLGASSIALLPVTIWIAGDVNGDGKVTILDMAKIGLSFNAVYGQPKYDDGADLNNDNKVTILDMAIVGKNFNKNA